jgi:preprotein translocase subunit SecE
MKNSAKIPKFLLILTITFLIILFIGILGFHYIANLEWIDSLHNSSMYLSGLGPLFEMKTNKEKLFSTFYAILASIFFLAIIIALVDKILQLELF